MILKPSPVSTSHFMYQRERNLLVAEISDLGRSFNFGRVYDDACDTGLTLVSHRTGREVVYGIYGIERDADGDITFWTLRPAAPADGNLPAIHLYND